jgi:IS5 family transposase
MLGKSPCQNQKDLFQPLLKEFINPQHELVLLADKMNWQAIEKEFTPLYSTTGTPSKPVRLMAGLLILKQLYNLGDETIVESYKMNPYMQYFCGEAYFQWNFPCDPSDLVHFRKRIGEQGVEFIFKQSILLFGKKAQEQEICVDTTVQEKNITFPTDTKLHVKIIGKCNKIAKKEGVEQRQRYTRKIKEFLLQSRFSGHPKRKHQARRAQRKIKTIAQRLVSELEQKLPQEKLQKHQQEIELFKKVLHQERYDKNKIYSLHEPQVSCIAKGKSSRPYEFGSKVSIARTKTHGIIVGVKSFAGNPHDSQTIADTLLQHERLTGKRAQTAIVDRGYAKREINGTQVLKPDNGKAKTEYEKRKNRKRFRKRASIEATI